MRLFAPDPSHLTCFSLGRPFTLFEGRADVTLVPRPQAADCVLVSPETWRAYRRFSRKFVWATNADNSRPYYKAAGVKFLAQPCRVTPDVIPMPLVMSGIEYEVCKNQSFIEKCRARKRTVDFLFIGNLGTKLGEMHRKFLTQLELPNSLMKFTDPIWHLEDAAKIDTVREFLWNISQARYVIAPRGSGSSSFRLYQSLCVGSVPIISGMVAYPFADEVEWSNFAIIDDDHSRVFEPGSILAMPWEQMRRAAMQFWDEYVWIPKMYPRLVAKIGAIR